MTKREAYEEGREQGHSAALYTKIGDSDRREAGCDHASGECRECLTSAAFESEQNARQSSPWEFLAHDINDDEDHSEGLWDAYDKGVAVGVKRGVRERLRKEEVKRGTLPVLP